MKKWLDDLYAIILKRGFKTLDNSLKNYNKFEKQLSKMVLTGTVEVGQSFTCNLNNYDIQINDLVVVKCIFSDTRMVVIPLIKFTSTYYNIVNNYDVSPGISMNLSSGIINITNNTEKKLTYSLYINNI